jgi:hypothetical protein
MPDFDPRWKYHPQHGGRLVTSAFELERLGAGWYDSPADFGHESHPTAPPVALALGQTLGSAVLPPPAPAPDPLLVGRVASLEAQVKSYEGEIVMLAEAVRELQQRVMSAEQQLVGVSQHLAHLSAPTPEHQPAPAPAGQHKR